MSTELSAPVPRDTAVDPALLDGAVLWLNRAVQSSGIELAVQVSEYVIDTFFAGDFALLTSHDPNKSASYRALCQREDLHMGAATLHRLVRIGQQVRHLPADVAQALTLRHHRALLTVANQQHRQHLARQALRHEWTSDRLASVIRAEKPLNGKPRGRPAQPAVVKWLAAVRRSSGENQDPREFAVAVGGLTAGEQADLRADLLALQRQIQALVAALPG